MVKLHSKRVCAHRTLSLQLYSGVTSLMCCISCGNGHVIALASVLCLYVYVTWHVLEVELGETHRLLMEGLMFNLMVLHRV